MLDSILNTTQTTAVTFSYTALAICTAVSLVCGVIIALVYMFKTTHSSSFAVTLALLPVIVQAIITLVNGNLGAGVAVMGAFSLVRFRSAPGTAREIVSIFFAMAIGLATGMGYVTYALIFTVVISALLILLTLFKFGNDRPSGNKTLKILIPESLGFDGVFDDLLEEYTVSRELIRVKTSEMGTIFDLTYNVQMKKNADEREFINKLRCRNGNLSISLFKEMTPAVHEEL